MNPTLLLRVQDLGIRHLMCKILACPVKKIEILPEGG